MPDPIRPEDLTAVKQDVDHVVELATSTALTAIDRRGIIKKTWAGLLAYWQGSGALMPPKLATAGLLAIGGFSPVEAQKILDSTLPLLDYAALRAYTGRAKGVRITQLGIAGAFQRNDADATSGSDGATSIVDALGRRWTRDFTGPADVKWWGAKGDGTTDDSASLQAAIDANKSKKLLISAGRFLHAGVLLDGDSYDGTSIICEGELLLRQRPNASTTNFQGNWVGLVLRGVSRVAVEYRGDGNRAVQPTEEHCHLVCIAGGSLLSFPTFVGREVRGDGIYIGQLDYSSSSEIPSDLTFGKFSVINSADDGRNAMSIISARRVSVDNFTSLRVGGLIGSVTEPGGFDIEPNHDFQTVESVHIGNAVIDTAGNFGFQVLGKSKSTLGGNVSDVTVETVSITSRGTPNSVTPLSFRNCTNVVASGSVRFAGPVQAAHVGLLLDNLRNAKIAVKTVGGALGVRIAYSHQVTELTLDADCRGYSIAAVQSVYVTRSKISVRAAGSGVGTYALYTRAMSRAGISQSDVDYTIRAPQTDTSGATVGCYNEIKDPISFSNVRFVGGSLTGYSSQNNAMRGFGAGVQKVNVQGVSYAPPAPTDHVSISLTARN
ncbi:pectate lyase-like protein [Variovorax sp. 54]|uniref:hypothetical protein n=1 Tax=Variovorax sp. 54 TaxID=2035212 RepID=UPI000C48F6F3|nr:hypothetical protein [Variovorax sp. 54]PIF76968.1 pectate lyase-like protein [Variovorax sp. 54]